LAAENDDFLVFVASVGVHECATPQLAAPDERTVVAVLDVPRVCGYFLNLQGVQVVAAGPAADHNNFELLHCIVFFFVGFALQNRNAEILALHYHGFAASGFLHFVSALEGQVAYVFLLGV